jgi:glutaredoxin 2
MPDTKSSKEIERQVRDLKALLDVSKAISNEAHLDDLLQVIMDKTTEVIDADRVVSSYMMNLAMNSGAKLLKSSER